MREGVRRRRNTRGLVRSLRFELRYRSTWNDNVRVTFNFINMTDPLEIVREIEVRRWRGTSKYEKIYVKSIPNGSDI